MNLDRGPVLPLRPLTGSGRMKMQLSTEAR